MVGTIVDLLGVGSDLRCHLSASHTSSEEAIDESRSQMLA
jgi:hypothetical protein